MKTELEDREFKASLGLVVRSLKRKKRVHPLVFFSLWGARVCFSLCMTPKPLEAPTSGSYFIWVTILCSCICCLPQPPGTVHPLSTCQAQMVGQAPRGWGG